MSKQLDAGPFEAEVISFRLHLAAEGNGGRTPDAYAGAFSGTAVVPAVPGPAAATTGS